MLYSLFHLKTGQVATNTRNAAEVLACICTAFVFWLVGVSEMVSADVSKTDQVRSTNAVTSLYDSAWPMFLHDLEHTGMSSYSGPEAPELLWKYKTGYWVQGSAAIGKDSIIYVGSKDKYLHAVGNDGLLKWKYLTEGGVDSSPAIGNDGICYVGSVDDCLYAIEPDGTLKWKYETQGDVNSSPAIGRDGTIYFGSFDNCVYALEPDGGLIWRFETGDKVRSSPAIGEDGTIYVGSDDGYLYRLNTDGSLKWKCQIFGWITSPVIGPNGSIYAGSSYNILKAINQDGSPEWEFKAERGIQASPAIGSDGSIYFGSLDGFVYALNPNGSKKWEFQTEGKIKSSPAIGANGTVYIASSDSYLYALKADGSLEWKYKTGDSIESSPVIGPNKVIYLGSQDNHLYAIGEPLAYESLGTLAGLANPTVSPIEDMDDDHGNDSTPYLKIIAFISIGIVCIIVLYVGLKIIIPMVKAHIKRKREEVVIQEDKLKRHRRQLSEYQKKLKNWRDEGYDVQEWEVHASGLIELIDKYLNGNKMLSEEDDRKVAGLIEGMKGLESRIETSKTNEKKLNKMKSGKMGNDFRLQIDELLSEMNDLSHVFETEEKVDALQNELNELRMWDELRLIELRDELKNLPSEWIKSFKPEIDIIESKIEDYWSGSTTISDIQIEISQLKTRIVENEVEQSRSLVEGAIERGIDVPPECRCLPEKAKKSLHDGDLENASKFVERTIAWIERLGSDHSVLNEISQMKLNIQEEINELQEAGYDVVNEEWEKTLIEVDKLILLRELEKAYSRLQEFKPIIHEQKYKLVKNQIHEAETALDAAIKFGCPISGKSQYLQSQMRSHYKNGYLEPALQYAREAQLVAHECKKPFITERLDSVKRNLEKAREAGCDVDDFEKLIGEAVRAFEAEKYDRARDLTSEASDSIAVSINEMEKARKEARGALDLAEKAISEAENFGCDIETVQKMKSSGEEYLNQKSYHEAAQHAAQARNDTARLRKKCRPEVSVDFSSTSLEPETWEDINLIIKNNGSAHAKDFNIKFPGRVDVEHLQDIQYVARGHQETMKIRIQPLGKGKVPVKYNLRYTDMDGKEYSSEEIVDFNVGTKPQSRHIPIEEDLGVPSDLKERYEIYGRIGSGGFSDVFKAKNKKTGDTVALKIPRGQSEHSTINPREFIREAKIWKTLCEQNVPNIVTLYEYGAKPAPWFAMEYMENGSLRGRIGKLTLDEGLDIAIKVCQALYHSHHHERIHRDIKPENVLFDLDNNPKVADWGLGKVVSQATDHATSPGTYPYSAPEQIDPGKFGSTDWRTDIYQMGGLLYEMVCGQPCFSIEEALQGRIVRGEMPKPSEVKNEVPEELDDIIMKAMATHKEDRYKDISTLQEKLEEFRRSLI